MKLPKIGCSSSSSIQLVVPRSQPIFTTRWRKNVGEYFLNSKLACENTQNSETAVQNNQPSGYTPFEYITFTDNQMLHEVSIEVSSHVEHVFETCLDTGNYGDWFEFIGQTLLHRDAPMVTSYFFYYAWGHLPALELYTTLSRIETETNKEIYDESIDGMPLAVSGFFKEVAEGKTLVTLRVAYLLPANLSLYVGPVGVWGDINDLLLDGLQNMKDALEQEVVP